jgi:predicted dinucleotide-binding enzyme
MNMTETENSYPMPITKQTIAFIGVQSSIGPAIAAGVCTENYRLLLFDEDPGELQILRNQICSIYNDADVEIIACKHSASWQADIIILSAPESQAESICEKIRDVALQKIVIAVSGQSAEKESDTLESVLPYSKIVKITALAPGTDIQKEKPGDEGKEVMLTSQNPESLEKGTELVIAAGYKPLISESSQHLIRT